MIVDQEFTLVVDSGERDLDRFSEDVFKAGCDDATVGQSQSVTRMYFNRSAMSLEEAVESATTDVEAAGAEVLGVEVE